MTQKTCTNSTCPERKGGECTAGLTALETLQGEMREKWCQYWKEGYMNNGNFDPTDRDMFNFWLPLITQAYEAGQKDDELFLRATKEAFLSGQRETNCNEEQLKKAHTLGKKAGREEMAGEMLEKIREKAHQQDDDSIWVNLDDIEEILALLPAKEVEPLADEQIQL